MPKERFIFMANKQTSYFHSSFHSSSPSLSLLLFLMLSRSLLLSLLKMTCNLSQADKRMRRAILHSSHKSAVIHILLLFSSPLISSPFFSSSLCSFPSLGFDSGCTEMKENRKTRQSTTNKVSLSCLVRCHFQSVCLSVCLAF